MSYGMGGGVFFFLRAFQRPEKQRIVVAAPPACGASCHLAAPGSASRLPANNWSFRSAITSCTADLAPARFASRPAARWGSLSLMLLRVSHWISRPAVNKLAPAAPGSGPDSLAGLPEVSLPCCSCANDRGVLASSSILLDGNHRTSNSHASCGAYNSLPLSLPLVSFRSSS